MSYLLNTPQDQQAMLEAIGVKSLDELLACIPESLRLRRPLDLPPAMSELELTQHMQSLAARNAHAGRELCFLGGGSYDHFIPAVVDALASRGEFYTSYTPYQPEVSQGNSAGDVRVPDVDLPVDRHGRLERQPLRRRQRHDGSRVAVHERHAPLRARS